MRELESRTCVHCTFSVHIVGCFSELLLANLKLLGWSAQFLTVRRPSKHKSKDEFLLPSGSDALRVAFAELQAQKEKAAKKDGGTKWMKQHMALAEKRNSDYVIS